MYNEIYKAYEFYESKFLKGYENVTGFHKIIEKIVEQSLENSPMKVYNEKLIK